MAAFKSYPIPKLLDKTNTLYVNARDDAEIAADLVEYNYTAPDDYDAGLALRAAVIEALKTVSAEDLDKRGATATVQTAEEDLRTLYGKHRRAARRAYPRGSEPYGALGLGGRVPGARGAFVEAARTLYATADARPDLLGPIRGLDAAGVSAGLAAVAAVEAASSAQTRETGEAQRASRLAQDAVRALREHAAELAESAEDALADKPQLREKLGLLERS